MKPHIIMAHKIWAELLSPNDLVVDATCGNGHDTLALAKLAKHVYAIDIQHDAISAAKERVASCSNKVTFMQGCHSQFPGVIPRNSIKLVVYNLGYLPGGDKTKTTMQDTTLASIRNALDLVMPGGMVSITCYPGHHEGKLEQDMLLEFAKGLGRELTCCHYNWINRPNCPSLLTIVKSLDQ